MDANPRVLTEEEYQEIMRVREFMQQRAMGLDAAAPHHSSFISKVKFNGENIEEFESSFRHVAEVYKVSKIFYEDYGRNKPAHNHRDYPEWAALNSTAFGLLERQVEPMIWSSLRDVPDMTAREVYDVLQQTCLRTTLRGLTTIQYEMEMVRMPDNATLSSHFGIMCKFFRELHHHGQILDDRTKIIKTMTKMSTDWYTQAHDWVQQQGEDLTFTVFRAKMLQREHDGRTRTSPTAPNAAFVHQTQETALAVSSQRTQYQQNNFREEGTPTGIIRIIGAGVINTIIITMAMATGGTGAGTAIIEETGIIATMGEIIRGGQGTK
jgi:hypothetical protein